MSSEAVVQHALGVLAELELPYMLVGSFSSNAYSIPRSTKDMDIVMRVESDEVQRFARRLGGNFELEGQIGFETKSFTTKHLIHAKDTPFKIEVFQLTDEPHDQSRFSRRVEIRIDEHAVFIASAEDTMIQKLRWARNKDLEDVRNMIVFQGRDNLDWDYIHRWTREHETQPRLDRILADLPEELT